MQTSALRDLVNSTVVDFVRDQWAQLGVSMELSRPPDTWAQDPEALLAFSLDVARADARLFDEILDWLRANGGRLSGRRLRHLAHNDGLDGMLVAAAVDWAAEHGSPLRLRADGRHRPAQSVSVFERPGIPGREDEIFFRHGLVKPSTRPSGKSLAPDGLLPINLAFRLRDMFGVTSRAEIIRFLLTTGVPNATTLAVSEAAVSTKRNANEALNELSNAGLVNRHVVGNEARYGVDRARWSSFLGVTPETIPTYRDWPALLRALGEIRRWLEAPGVDDLTDYLRASEARRLTSQVKPNLERSGVLVHERGQAEEYWPSFVQTVENALRFLEPAPVQA